MREITLELLKLLIMILAAVLTRFVIPWIRQKTQNEKLQTMLNWTLQAVLAAEQVFTAKTGAERKKIVTNYMQNILMEKGINLSDGELDILIEAAVKQMNDGAY